MAKQRKQKSLKRKLIKPGDITGRLCAWEGCEVSFEEPMPPDWRSLLVYWDPYPDVNKTLGQIATSTTCDRDAVLCPEHARMLEASLKDIARWTRDPVGGTA